MKPGFDTFLFDRVLSLDRLADYWKQLATQQDVTAALARYVSKQWDETPALHGAIHDLPVLDTHRDLINLMMSAVFPSARLDAVLASANRPFAMDRVFCTPGFDHLIEAARQMFIDNPEEFQRMADRKAVSAYAFILYAFYHVDAGFDYPIIYAKVDAQTGLQNYYRFQHDARFCWIEHEGDLPTLTKEQIRTLQENPLDLTLWQTFLPPDNFSFHGFAVIEAIDVTDQEVLSRLKNDLLEPNAMTTPERVDHLEARLRTLMQHPDLDLGFLCLEKEEVGQLSNAHIVGRSLLMTGNEAPVCPRMHDSAYAKVIQTKEPVLLADLADAGFDTAYEQTLREKGYESVLLAPLVYKSKLIGILELASGEAGSLDAVNTLKLMEVMTLFATSLQRSLDEAEDRIQAIIKRQYTALHPSVEWRFREAALRYMMARDQGEAATLEPIVFDNVYPIYGLTDIRHSSDTRNSAILDDLVEQLALALAVIVEASLIRPLPILDELGYRIGTFAQELELGLKTQDETAKLAFLRDEVEPLFDHLASFGPSVESRIADYRAAIDSAHGMLYKRRREFEESVTQINETVGAYLDAQEEKAQGMFPHFFEKYKTDGVDHSIYVGASLQSDGQFHPMYLRNLRLWQLMMMCGTEWALRRTRQSLPVALDVTHLILVHSSPLAIRFRQEEKQFDVDGAYNIRYEIVKKRIDKAVIKSTGERLTQPGTIAIVYAHAHEEAEYREYIAYLQASGFAEEEVESFALEDMQGVHGLRALRVTIREELHHQGDGLANADVDLASAVRMLSAEA
ncbi:MAG: GAF domain-containing protein [Bacteroidota bacterium]